MKMDLRKTGLKGEVWRHPSQERNLSLALPNTVNFQVSQKTRIDDSVLSIQMRLPTLHCSMYFRQTVALLLQSV